LIAVAISLGVAPASARDVQGWTLVDLGTLGGPGSYGAAVSDNGIVVGCSDVSSTSAHAFIYLDGVMKDLGLASDSHTGHSCALAVNNAGIAAGRSADGELVTWNGAAVTRLGLRGDIGGINDSGVVVGSYTEGASMRAFMYANGTVTALASSVPSTANAINARGDIAGTAAGHAFVYRSGTTTLLGTLGGNESQAKGINDASQLVGMSTDSHGQPLSFVYDNSMQALNAPAYSGAIAINNRGQVVGSSEGTHGYLLEAGNYTRLDTLRPVLAKGWRHMEPTGLNNHGWIVGTGTDADGNLRAFLLIPGTTVVAVRLAASPRVNAATTMRTSPP